MQIISPRKGLNDFPSLKRIIERLSSQSLFSTILARAAALSAAVLLLASPAQAFVNFSRTVTFGDSLTHNEILGLASGRPQSLYGSDPMEAFFIKGSLPGDKLDSFAVAGSESQDMELQVLAYGAAVLGNLAERATLIQLEIGGNDFLNNMELLAASPPGLNPAADSVASGIVERMHRSFRLLRTTHPDAQFIIWTVPDVTVTPAALGRFGANDLANISAHVAAANRGISILGQEPNVAVVDLFGLSREFALNPPVILGRQLVPSPAFGDFDHVFADEIHPTAVGNAIIANEIIRTANGVFVDTIPLYSEAELAFLARIGGA